MRKSHVVFAVLVMVIGMVPMSAIEAQGDLPTQTLFLGFIPNVQFAPIYVAIEKGYFAEEAGVNVVLEYGDENVGAERIAANELQFGMLSGEQVVLARYGGRPLVYIFEWYQQYPVGIVALQNAGINSIGDLAGRVVGVPGRFGASYVGLRSVLSANGMQESDIQLEEIGFNAAAMVCSDRVEASVVYIANEPVQIADQCGAVVVMPVASEIDLVANGLVTNETVIAENPELAAGMARAFQRALADTIADPDEAMRISRHFVETLPNGPAQIEAAIAADQVAAVLAAAEDGLSAEEAAILAEQLAAAVNHDEVVQMQVLLNSIALWDGPQLGLTEAASWENTLNALIETGLLPEAYDLSGVFTNVFVP